MLLTPAPWLLGGLLLLHEVRGEVFKALPVQDAFAAPDGYKRLVLTSDGQFPGPTIRAKKGDHVKVSVTNELSSLEGMAMHIHGLHQKGTPWMDGTMDSACLIMPDEGPFVYDFNLGDQVGTYWYHAHAGPFQRSDGLYGAFIVDDPDAPFHYDDDRVVVLSDWYHMEGREQAAGLMQQHFVWIGDPDSILINGKGVNDTCIKAASGEDAACETLARVVVDPGKTYLLRFIGATSLDMVDVAIDGHEFVVVESDGAYVEPFTTSHLLINSGERYSVLLKAKEGTAKKGEYWLQTQSRFRKLVPGYAVLSYQAGGGLQEEGGDGKEKKAGGSKPTVEPDVHAGMWPSELNDKENRARSIKADKNKTINDWKPLMDEVYSEQGKLGVEWSSQLKAHEKHRTAGGPPQPNRYFQLEGTQCRTDASDVTMYSPYKRPLVTNMTEGYLRWCVNDVAMRSSGSHTPLLLSAYYDQIDPKVMTKGAGAVQEIHAGDVVEVVLLNGYAMDGVNEQHPWHLHGHSFWVMGQGQGQWNEADSWHRLNFKDPPLKDTVTVYPFGWTVIRFVADNPGVWPLHCHIETHQVMGMQVFFVERKAEIPAPPEGFQLCGNLATARPASKQQVDDSTTQHHRHGRGLLNVRVHKPGQKTGTQASKALSNFLTILGLLAAMLIMSIVVTCMCYAGRIKALYASLLSTTAQGGAAQGGEQRKEGEEGMVDKEGAGGQQGGDTVTSLDGVIMTEIRGGEQKEAIQDDDDDDDVDKDGGKHPRA